jgi:hypothetical protein
MNGKRDKAMLRSLLAALVAVAWTAAPCHAGGLFILSTSLTKPNVIEKDIGDKVKSASVKVFARYSDFKAMVEKEKPDAVIAPLLALKELGLANDVKVQGLVGGKEIQSMVLVSLEPGVDIVAKPDAQIGVLDIAGRSAMRIVLVGAAGEKSKIKLVTKLEDLLPMLTFKSADAVLVTAQDFEELKGRTQAKLVAAPVNGVTLGAVAVATFSGGGTPDKVVAEVKALSKKDLKMLGVESWK